jgi:hypothetical protein
MSNRFGNPDLAGTRKLNADIKTANIGAGAKYGTGSPYHIDEWQSSEFEDAQRPRGNLYQCSECRKGC